MLPERRTTVSPASPPSSPSAGVEGPSDERRVRNGQMQDAEEILGKIEAAGPGLEPVLRFVFASGGKRLRPLLLQLCAALFPRPSEHLPEAAALVEVLHNGTLLHDDVMDRAHRRRNRPTVHRLWGVPVAILAGDFLLAAAMDLALRTGSRDLLQRVVRTLMDLARGQLLEVQHTGDLAVEEQVCMEIARKKTGALFALACGLGGVLCGGTPAQVEALECFGLHLGLSFQLLDDLQDFLPASSGTGKDTGRDLAEAKVTLPVVRAFRNAGPCERIRIERIYRDPDRGRHLKEMTRLLHALGGVSHTLGKSRSSLEEAVTALDAFPPSTARRCLEETAWRLFREGRPAPTSTRRIPGEAR